MSLRLPRRQRSFVAMSILVSTVGSAALVGCSDSQGVAASGPSAPVPAAPGDVATQSSDPTAEDIVVQTVSAQRPTAQKPRPTQSISFNDITFKMEKEDAFLRSMLTKKIEAYDGQSIRIRGFILPSFKQNGLTEFVLVRDNMECCFGPGAALYDCIMVRMQNGTSTRFSVRPVTVEGKFRIDEWKDFDGVVRAIYHLDSESVK